MKLNRVFRKSVLWTSIVAMLLAAVTVVNVTSASPEPYIYLDPAVIGPGDISGGYLPVIYIKVADAPLSYAWEISLSWDPTLLDLWLSPVEDSFLHRTVHDTIFAWHEEDGEVKIGCTLQGEVPWASGSGVLCKLYFMAVTDGSTLLNLFDTKLFDHLVGGTPAPTTYGNEDSFCYTVDPSHDIRITDVTAPSPLTMGDTASASVTVLNEGTETEDFTITVYANGSSIGSTNIVGLPGAGDFEDRSTTFEVQLDTTAVALYTISADAGPVTDETDTADNSVTDGTVVVVRPDLWCIYLFPTATEIPFTEAAVIFVMVMNLAPTPQYFDIEILVNGVMHFKYSWYHGGLASLLGGAKALFLTPLPTALGDPVCLAPGYGLYVDMDGSGDVSGPGPPYFSGDIRGTPVIVGGTMYPKGSYVQWGDADVGAIFPYPTQVILPPGTWTIGARVLGINPYETNLGNNMAIDGDITVVPIVFPDLNVTAITPYIPEVHGSVPIWVPVGITVKNDAPLATDFDIELFANGDLVQRYSEVYAMNATLASKQTKTFLLYMETTGLPEDTYFLSAYVPPVAGEVDTTDNNLTQGAIVVTYATPPELHTWKLKLNRASGPGIGHQSTVGAENLLEAHVINEGTHDVLVQAMFQITDAVGTVIAEEMSDVQFLPIGQITTLSGSWTASDPGIYYITAYLSYGTQFPILPTGSFSRTLSLRVDSKPHA